jgi:hypothetical protein
MLLDEETGRPPTREAVEEMVQVANASRGINYQSDWNGQAGLSLLARALLLQQVRKPVSVQWTVVLDSLRILGHMHAFLGFMETPQTGFT